MVKSIAILLNKRNTYGQTPIMAACLRGHARSVTWLLSKVVAWWCGLSMETCRSLIVLVHSCLCTSLSLSVFFCLSLSCRARQISAVPL